MNVKCSECGGSFPYFEDPAQRPYADCPGCHALVKVGERPPYEVGKTEAFTDGDNWSPWLPHLSPMDKPRYKEWIKSGKVRRNPKTGCLEGYCSTRKEYEQRVKECGFTTEWLGQGNRENRREGRDEWQPTKASSKKFFM